MIPKQLIFSLMPLRSICLVSFILFSLSLSAIVQKGIVRSLARPNKASVGLEGVVIRAKGQHNAVETAADGQFSLVLPKSNNGDPLCIYNIRLSGWELADKDMLFRNYACSEAVPIEIVLVNKAELEREKEAIAEKARTNVELFYEQRLSTLDSLLAAGKLNEQAYEQQLNELEQRYEQFSPLIELMADKYSRTDVTSLTQADQDINAAIESGNLDEAQRLIEDKGNLQQREQKLAAFVAQNAAAQQQLDDIQRRLSSSQTQADKQRRELADDYFHLYTIALNRFDNDTAAYFLYRRAELDTTNADYQIEAAQFAKNIIADYNKALNYLQRAMRHTNPYAPSMALATHEAAQTYQYLKDFNNAKQLYEKSLKIREITRNNFPEERAETLTCLADFYTETQDYKKALKCQKEALFLFEQAYGSEHVRIAVCHSNIGMIYYSQEKNDLALTEFKTALKILQSLPDPPQRELANIYNNLAAVYFRYFLYDDCAKYVEKALEINTRVLGPNHPKTKITYQNLQLLLKMND